MNQILDKVKEYPLAAISLVLFVALAIMLVLRGGVVDELTMQETELMARIQAIDTNVKNSNNLEQDLQILQRDSDLIRQRLFKRDQRAVNIDFFYSFEDQLDVVISEVSQLSVEDPALAKGGPNALKQYSTIAYNIKVAGTFQEILELLHAIHQADAFIRVADFQVRVGTNQERKAEHLSAQLRVIVLAEKS